jgi:transposase-like protein
MKKRFSDEQIISILREAEAGVSARELCRKHAISDATFYTWRKKYGGMEVPEVKRLKLLRKRTPDSRSCLPKLCWIRRHFRWHWGESTDDRLEAGSC